MDSTSAARRLMPVCGQLISDTGKPSTSHNVLHGLYVPIAGALAEVERRIDQELQNPHPAITELLRHGTQLGGKRLRPALVLLAAAAVGDISADHILLGAVIEMVHTATLVHDDVLDAAETRRHVPTVNAKWNNHTSILVGDYLFAQSFRLAATLATTTACCRIGEAARRVCEGELRQVLRRDHLNLDEENYVEIIRGKTAELCRVACQLGAEYCGADGEQINALGRYGNAIGIAFQIADDHLDLWGSGEIVGKTLGTDVKQGKMTLPIIRLLTISNPQDRQRITRILQGPSEHRVEQLRPFLQASDARQYTKNVALRYRNQAIEALDLIAESPAKASLIAIADFSVDRRF